MGPATAPALEMPSTTSAHPPLILPRFKVWTMARILPLIAIIALAIASVAVRPDVIGSLIVVISEICLMVWLVKTWLVH
jgi:hypothetical protein